MNAFILAANLLLVPFGEPPNGYIGEIPFIEVCEASYSELTELAPGTRINVEPPFTEIYGEGSVINRGDGMTCSTCKVPVLRMKSDGVITLYCEVAK